MATRKKFEKSGRIRAKGEQTSPSRGFEKWAGKTMTLIGVVSPWVIFWISSGK